MACKRSAVRSRLPPPLSHTGTSACSNKAKQSGQVLSPSSRGLGHHPFTVSTGVRIPVGSPSFVALGFVVSVKLVLQSKSFKLPGVVVQLVRIPACHAGGRGFEPRPLRQIESKNAPSGAFFIGAVVPPRGELILVHHPAMNFGARAFQRSATKGLLRRSRPKLLSGP